MKRIHVFEHGRLAFSFGTSGTGRGQIGHIFAISVARDGSTMGIDWGRRRRIWWNPDGSVRRDDSLLHGTPSHPLVGSIVSVGGGEYIDLPMGGRVTGFAVSQRALDTLALVYAVDSLGHVVAEWGRLERPLDTGAVALRTLLQIGDLAVTDDSVYVLRGVEPRIEVYPRGASSPTAARSIALQRWRRGGRPTQQGGRVNSAGFVVGANVELRDGASVFARDHSGRFFVVTLGPIGEDDNWPPEEIWVYDADGRLLRKLAHDGRDTRMIAFADDGSLVTLSHPNDSRHATWNVLVYAPPDSGASTGSRCVW